MALKIYQKFGLRRDNDLSDLPNPTLSLSNILDNVESGKSFKAEDLQVIKGMYSQGLESDTFLQVAGSAETSTDSDGRTTSLKPYVSYHNRLDLSALYAGTPRIFGGDGPNAKYYDFNQVTNPIRTDPLDNDGMWVTNTIPFAEDQFWERGQFAWDRKLHEKSSTVNGGIEWEGYYVPTGTGNHSFTVGTTGCWTLDFQRVDYANGFQPGDDWDITNSSAQTNGAIYSNQLTDTHSTIYKNYAFIRPEVDISCSRIDGETLQIVNTTDYNKIAVGMTCINDTYIEGGTDGAKVLEYDTANGKITLNPTLVNGNTAPGNAPVKGSFSGNQTIKFVQGTNQPTSAAWKINYPLTKGTPYRFKLRYFTPQDWDSNKSNRYLNITETIPNGGGQSQLNYRKLYSLTYDFSEKAKGSFNKFLDSSILFGGGTTGGTTHAKYTAVRTTKKIDARYDPINLTLTNDYDSSNINGKRYPYKRIEIWEGTETVVQNSSSMAIDNTSGMEVGNYIYDHSWAISGATGTKYIADGTRIVEIIANSSIILSSPFLASGSTTFKIIEHRGHIKRFVADHNNSTTLTLKTNTPTGNAVQNAPDELKKKMIVVGQYLPINTQIDVRPTTTDTVVVTANTTGGNLTNIPYYVYDYQGLINDSMLAFCEPNDVTTQNICLTVDSLNGDVDPGDTTITFSTSGVTQATWDAVVAMSGTNRVLGYYFDSGTTATATSGTGNTRGTLSFNKAVTKLIKEGNNFTLTSDMGTEDKSLCCPPKDTAPPFAANDDGMFTIDNPDDANIGYETLDVLSGNVVFDNIRATILPSTEIIEPNNQGITYDSFLGTNLNKRIRFKSTTDGNTYRLFVSTQ